MCPGGGGVGARGGARPRRGAGAGPRAVRQSEVSIVLTNHSSPALGHAEAGLLGVRGEELVAAAPVHLHGGAVGAYLAWNQTCRRSFTIYLEN